MQVNFNRINLYFVPQGIFYINDHDQFRYKAPNEIGNYRQISPYVANYRNELRLFTHEVGMPNNIRDSWSRDYFSEENDVILDVNYWNLSLKSQFLVTYIMIVFYVALYNIS